MTLRCWFSKRSLGHDSPVTHQVNLSGLDWLPVCRDHAELCKDKGFAVIPLTDEAHQRLEQKLAFNDKYGVNR